MKTRREFIKKVSIGSVALSSLGCTTLDNKNKLDISKLNKNKKTGTATIDELEDYVEWKVLFDESNSILLMVNASIVISGRLLLCRDPTNGQL